HKRKVPKEKQQDQATRTCQYHAFNQRADLHTLKKIRKQLGQMKYWASSKCTLSTIKFLKTRRTNS
ncbi:MAG: hypothetical protein CBB71_21965, partial [Rhodopirellula sp. TMED11]